MRSHAVLLAVVAAGIAISIATGGVSPAQLDRGAAIDVVGDSSASIGYAAECAGGTFSVSITNRFDGTLDVVEVAVNGSTATETPMTVEPWGSRTVSFGIDRVSPGDTTTVEVRGPGTRAVLERPVPPTCGAESGEP